MRARAAVRHLGRSAGLTVRLGLTRVIDESNQLIELDVQAVRVEG